MRADINVSPRTARFRIEQADRHRTAVPSIWELSNMNQGRGHHSASPMVLLRISDGSCQMHRAFSDFSQAVCAAEAYAGTGFVVAMISATGRFLMRFEPHWQRIAV